MKEKVLITGGAGYIGSVLTEHLLEKGYKVTVLDCLYYRQRTLLNMCANKNFDFIYGDARDEQLSKKVVPGFDVIIPLAAIVGAPACDFKTIDAQTVNHDAIVSINKIRKKSQIIVFPTTNSGYGTKSGEVFCTEETPLEPISFYGKIKVAAEKELIDSDNTITLRLATVFGFSQRMRTDLLVNDFVFKAVNDGYLVVYEKDFKRNYLHIRDVARCFEHCIRNFKAMKNQTYNVGLEDANLSKEELVNKIKEYIPGLTVVYRKIGKDIDKRNYIVSNKKLLGTGYECRYSLDDGIQELIKGYKILRDNQNKNT